MKAIEQIPIKESLKELESVYKTTPDFLKLRVKMLMCLKNEPQLTKPQLARKLEVVYNSISKWQELYAEGGMEKLLEVNRGKYTSPDRRTMGLAPEVYSAIEKRHNEQPFQSYMELHTWVLENQLAGIKYSTLIKYIDLHFGQSLRITRMLKLDVKESVLKLETILTRCLPRIKPRVRMLLALKQDEKISRNELASKLNVSYGSIIKWSNIYRTSGIDELLRYNITLVITPEVLAFIDEKFKKNQFDNFSEIYTEVNSTFKLGIKYYTLHRYIHRHFAEELEVAKSMHMPIKETIKELEEMYGRCSSDKKRRIKMLLSLKNRPGSTKMELAELSDVAVGSIHRWCKQYKSGGINSLLELKMRGRKQLQLPNEIHKLIGNKLKQNPDMNITELYEWLTSFYKPDMSYNKLYRYVRRNFLGMPNSANTVTLQRVA